MNKNYNIALKSKVFISGTVTTLTGLHIGGNSVELQIGGADSIVIRDPITNNPYIPGSSLRGKMRSLLEQSTGFMDIKIEYENKNTKSLSRISEMKDIDFDKVNKNGIQAGPSTSFDSTAAQLFGKAINQKDQDSLPIPQRLIVRDAFLTEKSIETLKNAKNTDMPMSEVKTEVVIDRITSEATPRQIERVPAGAKFGFEFILNLYGEDKPIDYLEPLFESMALLQDDYLGGSGSRGYGRVKFEIENIAQKTVDDYKNNRSVQIINIEIPELLQPRPE